MNKYDFDRNIELRKLEPVICMQIREVQYIYADILVPNDVPSFII